ncbi:MAG: rhodanese-like domain-containing protein [Porticoccaceae bacterium]
MGNGEAFERISAQTASQRLTDAPETRIVDVREPDEIAASAVPGAINIPKGLLDREIAEALPDRDTPVLLCCAAGGRAAMAAETLCAMGYRRVSVIAANHADILRALRAQAR